VPNNPLVYSAWYPCYWNWRQTTRETIYRYESGKRGGQPFLRQPHLRNEYDRYGNIEKEYNANSNPPTVYIYDSATNTFPVSITNPKGHVTTKGWDFRFGKEDWISDPNGNLTDYYYDPFGRLTVTDFPDGGQTEKVFYDYCTDGDCTNAQFPLHVLTRVKESDASFVETHLFYDGLGRKAQTVTKGENQFVVSKIHYDAMGRAVFESGPFHQPSAGFLDWLDEGYPISDYPYAITSYDKRSRPSRIERRDEQNGITATTHAYSGFSTTTDPDLCAKTETRDHLERIIEVIDHPDSGDIHPDTNTTHRAI
jgi:YD repeat-containing protein